MHPSPVRKLGRPAQILNEQLLRRDSPQLVNVHKGHELSRIRPFLQFSEQDVAFRSRSEEIFPAPSPLNQPCKAAPPKKRRCQSDSTCNDKKKRKPFNMSSEGDSQFGAGRHEPLGQQEERAQIGNPSEAGDGNGSASGGCATESSSPGALNSGGGDNDGSNATAQRVTRQETIGYGQLGAFGRGTRGCAKGGATTNVVKGRPRNQRVGGQLEAEDVPILAKCTHYSTNKSDKNRQYECRNTRQFPFKTCTRHLATNRQNRATRAAERKRGQNMGCSDLGALSEATAGVDWDERDEDLPGYLAAAPPELQSFLIAGTGARNKNNGENHESLLWACADAGGVETGTVMRQPGSADHYSSEPLILRKQSRTAFENGAFGPLSPSSSLVIDGKSSASEGGAPLQSERLGRPDLEPQESGDFQESIHVALSELRRVGNTPLPFDSLLEPAADPEDIPETDSFQLDANLPVPI